MIEVSDEATVRDAIILDGVVSWEDQTEECEELSDGVPLVESDETDTEPQYDKTTQLRRRVK